VTVTDTVFSGDVANAASGFASRRVEVSGYGGGIDAGFGQLTATGVALVHNTATAGVAMSSASPAALQFGFATALAVGFGGGIYGGGTLTLNHSSVAGNFTLGTPSDISVRDGGRVDPASANNLIGTGGSGGLVNGVNGNIVL
jgi:hypothetical protein